MSLSLDDLRPGSYVDVTVPALDIAAERFHVNDVLQVGSAADWIGQALAAQGTPPSQSAVALVFQRADASEEWVGLVVLTDDGLTRAFRKVGEDGDPMVVADPGGVEVTPSD